MIKAIFFDLDGTLLNTLPDIRRHLNDALTAHGYPEIGEEQAKHFIGDGARKLVERALPQGAKFSEEVFEDFSKRYAANDNSLTCLYDGEAEFLDRLVKRGVKLGIVTNKPQNATLGCVEKFFKSYPFEFVSGESGLFPRKPDPTLALYAALTMRVPVGECAFVGDGETDVRTAINAGMFGVATLWGYREKEQLQEAGATRFANTFEELEKILFA
ncbi:MAG: HAD family hydrolase [Clostridia bacterium]|nr:HAD family hydrolase [Clostridia bacterium]